MGGTHKADEFDRGTDMVDRPNGFVEWLKKLAEPLTLVTLLLLFLATFGSFWATRDLVNDAKDASARQTRAYVVVRPVNINIDGPGKKLSFRYLIGNIGQTPAYNVRHGARLDIWPFPLPKDFVVESPTDLIGGMILGNGVSAAGLTTAISEQPISAASAAGLQQDGKRIYLVVLVKYFDTFKKVERTTKLCVAVSNLETVIRAAGITSDRPSGQSPPDSVEYDYTTQHNDSD